MVVEHIEILGAHCLGCGQWLKATTFSEGKYKTWPVLTTVEFAEMLTPIHPGCGGKLEFDTTFQG